MRILPLLLLTRSIIQREGRSQYNDNSPRSWLIKAREHAANNEYDQAIEDISHAISLDLGNPNYFVERASVFHRMKNLHGALVDCSRAIELDPFSAGAFNLRGLVLLDNEDYFLALSDFLHALRIDPHYISAYYNAAITYEKADRKKQALEYYRLFLTYADPIEMEEQITKSKSRIEQLELSEALR